MSRRQAFKGRPVVDVARIGRVVVESLGERVRKDGRQAVRVALRHFQLKGVIPGFAQRCPKLADAAVLRIRTKTLEYGTVRREARVRWPETGGYCTSRCDGR